MSMRMLHLQNETNASCPDLQGEGYKASFHTHSSARGPRKKIYHGHLDGKGPRNGEHAVVKVFRDGPGSEAQCDTEIDKHRLAQRLAHRFNKLVPDTRGRITFTLPLKSRVESLGVGNYLARHRHGRHIDKMEWVLVEENLTRQGEYQVFLRKSGESMEQGPTTLDAFLHFTFHESGRKFLLCGFQGVQTENGYLLTTPCIHSEDSTFGAATDGGPKMLRKVMSIHRCTNLCYNYEKPDEDFGDVEDTSPSGLALDAEDRLSDRTSEGDPQEDSSRRSSADEAFSSPDAGDEPARTAALQGGAFNAARRLFLKGFRLGRGFDSNSRDLAYCSEDLPSEVLEQIEEEQQHRRAEKESKRSRCRSESSEYRRIHLGDQLQKSEKNAMHRTKKFDMDEPSHRSNCQAIYGIEKRPSF